MNWYGRHKHDREIYAGKPIKLNPEEVSQIPPLVQKMLNEIRHKEKDYDPHKIGEIDIVDVTGHAFKVEVIVKNDDSGDFGEYQSAYSVEATGEVDGSYDNDGNPIPHPDNERYIRTEDGFDIYPRITLFTNNFLKITDFYEIKRQVYLTLYHEMVHAKQHPSVLKGKQNRQNVEWGNRLVEIDTISSEYIENVKIKVDSTTTTRGKMAIIQNEINNLKSTNFGANQNKIIPKIYNGLMEMYNKIRKLPAAPSTLLNNDKTNMTLPKHAPIRPRYRS